MVFYGLPTASHGIPPISPRYSKLSYRILNDVLTCPTGFHCVPPTSGISCTVHILVCSDIPFSPRFLRSKQNMHLGVKFAAAIARDLSIGSADEPWMRYTDGISRRPL